MAEYRLIEGSPQDDFRNLRTKVQIFGGGYGNGKTAGSIVSKILPIARDYPGANILVARATYPKLNDTIRKEFLKWAPASWIKSFPLSKNADNTCTLTNGTTINFRYLAQQGKTTSEGEHTTSNLLSATYDLIVVDQLEDPEITEKDFDDLLGRLRGNARYIGSDPTMPTTGPRWLIATLNPTRNWAYRRLIAPLKKYQTTGLIDPLLLVKRHPRDIDGDDNPLADQPVLDKDGKPEMLIALVEGSTYTNKHNLGADFLETLESAYRGQMRDRYLYGEWAAYEGLVYPEFGEASHCLTQDEMFEYLQQMRTNMIDPEFIEGYDFGIVLPSCYLLAFIDRYNNVFVCDGFQYPAQDVDIDGQQALIWKIRENWGVPDNAVWADPAIFKKTQAQRNAPIKTVAQLFGEGRNGIRMRASDNEILAGITKVSSYLSISQFHRHPITRLMGAPHIYVATELMFLLNEFSSYYWKTDKDGSRIDQPVDKNDHGMDALKYMLAKRPDIAQRTNIKRDTSYITRWTPGRYIDAQEGRSRRHG